MIFFKNQNEKDKKEYIKLLKITGSLSNLFADTTIPFIYYRAMENIFCKAFKADNLSRSDIVPMAKSICKRRENKSNLCPTLTANMRTGGHNVPLVLTKYGIRKLTPEKCFRFQGYPEDFKLPTDIVQSHLYKQARNSVVVPVIQRLAEEIKYSVKKTDKEP